MPALLDHKMYEQSTVTCVNAVPIFKKIKVLKKLRKKIGLGSRSENSNMRPLLFNQVCGDNIRIEQNGKIARRVESFCKGITFSNRPVKVGERICVKLTEISSNWSGVIRFGFSSQDPIDCRDALPKFACPDLTNKPGYWAKALSERYGIEGLVIYFYITANGDVYYGVNGEEKGLFFSGVETSCPLWVLVDVYGNSTSIEFMDMFATLNNRLKINNNLISESVIQSSSLNSHAETNTHSAQSRNCLHDSPGLPASNHSQRLPNYNVPVDNSQSIQSSLRQRSLNLNYLQPFPFHRVKGHNVLLNSDYSIASRSDNEYSHGYIFTARPLKLGESFVIKIQQTESMYVGAVAFGLTAANPAGLVPSDLPEDCDLLLDRPEYWVVCKDVASSPLVGDELTFKLSINGEVTYSKNGSQEHVIMHVDQSLHLWAFFDVYGNTKCIKMLGSVVDAPIDTSSQNIYSTLPPTQLNSHISSSIPQNHLQHHSLQNEGQSHSSQNPEQIQRRSPQNPGQISQMQSHSPQNHGQSPQIQSHPPQNPRQISQIQNHSPQNHGQIPQIQSHPPQNHSQIPQIQSHFPQNREQILPIQSNSQNTNPFLSRTLPRQTSEPLIPVPPPRNSVSIDTRILNSSAVSPNVYSYKTSSPDKYPSTRLTNNNNSIHNNNNHECTVCYEKCVDSVLYMCGHMCMCYDCAIRQWRGRGGGLCPICRAPIRDVIRTYRS